MEIAPKIIGDQCFFNDYMVRVTMEENTNCITSVEIVHKDASQIYTLLPIGFKPINYAELIAKVIENVENGGFKQ